MSFSNPHHIMVTRMARGAAERYVIVCISASPCLCPVLPLSNVVLTEATRLILQKAVVGRRVRDLHS